MKTTKIMNQIMVAFVFLLLPGNAFCQTDAENHGHLTAINQAIMTHTQLIVSGEAKTRNDQVTEYNETRRALSEAKKTHSLLKKVIPEKSKSEAIIHHDKIDRFYASATAMANSMLEDLKGETPDVVKLKEHAKKLRDAIDLAEKEQQELIKVTR